MVPPHEHIPWLGIAVIVIVLYAFTALLAWWAAGGAA